ncbi:hypothetical protein HYW87_00660, partial [Candidatus Roizmanbacteria bacterium]|nr:hypothetical protein [Candidatus Roizmanbacteria bacterium]
MMERLPIASFPGKKTVILFVSYAFSLTLFIRLPQGDYKIWMMAINLIFLFSIFRFFLTLKNLVTKNKVKERMIITTLWLTAFFVMKRVAPESWLLFTFDNTTVLFFSYLPIVFLFNLTSLFNGLVSVMLVAFMALYSLYKYEEIAEVFAILVFFM